jgi:phospholipid transport system substrate-binding protein
MARRWVDLSFFKVGFLVLSIGATTVGAGTGALAQDMAKDAAVFVQSAGNRAIEIVMDRTLTVGDRELRFRDLFMQIFDVPSIGRFVLGHYWRVATDAERTEFLSLFEEMIVSAYTGRFAKYNGEQFTVAVSHREDDDRAMVMTNVVRPRENEPIKIDWRVGKFAERLKIFDVIVEGVSMSVAQKEEFGSFIQRNGGQIAPLLTAMRDRVEHLRLSSSN